jgi:transposase
VALDLEREKDPEILRQAALLLEAENRRLLSRVATLTKQLLAAQGKDASELQLELERLQQQLDRANRSLFGRSSEKRSKDEATPADPRPKTGHGPRPQELPLLTTEHTLDAADMVCTSCGGELRAMDGQTEESEEIDLLERRYVRRRHVRKKYSCRCGACIETAPGPKKLFARARYSIAFTIAVAVAKYLDHMPLERQVRAMARDGLVVDSQTLYDQIDALARLLQPLYARLGAQQRGQPVVFADETPWPVYGKGEKAQGTKWHAWTLASPLGVYYEIHDSRSAEAAKSLLGDYAGIVVTDGYAVYEKLQRESEMLRLAQCWAHVRRRFVDCESTHPKASGEILSMIGELYAVERAVPGGREGDDERRRRRASESRAILTRIQRWCIEVDCTPGSTLAAAIRYMSERWSRLTLFLEHPDVPLDNNAAERALRGPVVGRKNHYGSRSRRGSEVAAILYSLLESAKLVGLDPAKYLEDAVHAALDGRTIPLPSEVADAAAA